MIVFKASFFYIYICYKPEEGGRFRWDRTIT